MTRHIRRRFYSLQNILPFKKVLICTTSTLVAVYICYEIYLHFIFVPVVEPELSAWPRNASRNIQYYLNFSKPPLITPLDFCTPSFWFVIFVHSHIKNFEARTLIRKTWGIPYSIYGKGIRVLFIFGEKIPPDELSEREFLKEVETHGDIVQFPFTDTYENLTLKSVLMLKVAFECRHYKFLMKTDDDVYLNMPRIFKLLAYMQEGNRSETDLLVGQVLDRSPRFTSAEEKFYCPRYMFDGDIYPPYLHGLGYLMTISVAEKLFKAALDVKLFHLEDIFITGLCAKHAGIPLKNIIKFAHEDFPEDLCDFVSLYVVTGIRMEALKFIHTIYDEVRTPCILAGRGDGIVCCV